MQREHLFDAELMLAEVDPGQPDALVPLLDARPPVLTQASLPEVVVGELVAITDDGCTPLIQYPGQAGSPALRARSVVDLHGAHIGKLVVLSFEDGDASKPIVMGVMRQGVDRPLEAHGQVQIDTDGERMIVSAKEQMVLQCGKASITLTKAGKVLIQGVYVSSRSTGVNRIRGGSVQLN
jgi:hypothetical protein